ncbi:MAG: helix-hairpin-helix domain-containing protein, partial [Flavobacteriales bacterium]|nr:helix-hairpin-helix domain-containing protein [Flavobacteriales bacterium]
MFKLFKRFRSYFIHHRAERRGTVFVLVLSLTVMAVAMVYPRLVEPSPPEMSGSVFERLTAIASSTARRGQDMGESSGKQVPPVLFNFDPNQLSDSGFSALGFSPKEIGTLRKYMAAGAEFREKDDFGRLYFMDEARFDSIRPYLLLPEKAPPKKTRYSTQKFEKKERVKWSDTADYDSFRYNPIKAELNSADTNELLEVAGIGSFYARLIVEYREELGGYFTLAQLMELWKMTEENVDRIAGQVEIDTAAIRKININSATAQQLSKHPYISFGLASKIVTRREERR